MGRPAISQVRERLGEMLFIAGKLTAYDAHKHYVRIFANITQRNVYYQLRRGVELGIFKIEEVEERGEYSWGTSTRKVYYELTPRAGPQMNKLIKDYFDTVKNGPTSK